MSEAEKVQLRYIQILKSTSEWQGDMGRTLISPSNAIRILKQQFTLLGRAIGRIFIPIIMKAIPYVMALTQVLTDLANRLAKFFGYELTDIDYSSLKDVQIAVGDIGDEAESTTNKLNTMLAPFDELNVVQKEASGVGAGVGGLGGDLGLDLPEYDALAGLTDKLSKNVDKARKNLEKFLKIAKKVAIVLGVLWGIGKLAKFINYIKTLKDTFSFLNSPINLVKNSLKTLVTKFTEGYTNAKLFGEGGLKSILSSSRNLLTPLEKVGLTVAGTAVSFITGYNNMKNFALGTESLNTALSKTVTVTGLAAGTVLLFGTPVGAAITLVGGLTGALIGYQKGLEQLRIHNTIFDEQGVSIDLLSNHFVTLFDSSTKYISSIENLSTKYIEAKSTMEDTRGSLDLFIESLALQDTKISSSQLEELKDKYTLLRETIMDTHKTMDEFYIGLIKSHGEMAKNMSVNTAQQIAEYKALSSTIAGYEQEYIDKEEELTMARYTGKISVDEYNDEIRKLKIEYGYATDGVANLIGFTDIFKNSISDIDYTSVENLNENLGKTKDSYNRTITKLEEYKENLKTTNAEAISGYQDVIDRLQLYGDNSEETQQKIAVYQGMIDEQNLLLQNDLADVDNAILDVQGSYKGYLAGLYADLVSQGALNSSEFKTTIDSIKGDLNTLKDVDMSETGEELYNSMEQSILGSGSSSMISKVRDAMKKVGVSGSDELMNYLTPQEKGLIDTYNTWFEVGDSINKGLTRGIENASYAPQTSITNTSHNIEDKFKTLNGIHSPSTLYTGFGKYLMEGLAQGITKNQNIVSNALKNVSDSVKKVNFSIDSNKFGNSLNELLTKLQTFSDKFRNGINSLLSTFTTTMNGIRVQDEKLYYTQMPYIPIPRFATGGFPKTGEFFMAREDGPEMIGRIGNQTAVANNDQITTSITNALVTALSGMNFGNNQGVTVVNIGGKKVYEGMGEYVDSENDRYGTNYIKV